MAFSRDGSKLAIAMNTRESLGSSRSSTGDPGKQLLQLSGHTRVVRCLAFNADGTRLVTGSLDKTIVVWVLLSGANNSCFVDMKLRFKTWPSVPMASALLQPGQNYPHLGRAAVGMTWPASTW